ncbi:MAG: hypothetical protein QXR59_00525 [Candidatus Bathyarchaeia archaeon]
MVFSGTEVVSDKGKAIVVAIGMNTEFDKIAEVIRAVKACGTELLIRKLRLIKAF